MSTLYKPELLLINGEFVAGAGLIVGASGRVEAILSSSAEWRGHSVELPRRALLPGLVNAHSHTFQRLIRGRSETRGGNFWSWRDAMYCAAAGLSAQDLYCVSRMAFLEMAAAGITTVGEFHYLHRQPDGSAYDDPNEMAHFVIAAARSVGLRIALLRVAYFRAGYNLRSDPGQQRFYETPDEFGTACDALHADLAEGDEAWMGAAPHSVRAVPIDEIDRIAAWALEREVPLHLHAAEQRAELYACLAEYEATPVDLLAQHRVLGPKATLVHAVHVTDGELDAIAESRTTICACPTTERNLGDGIVRARDAAERGIRFAFGTDSQAQINLMEDARALEYHLRLQTEQRLLLDGIDAETLPQRVFRYASQGGAVSLGADSGTLAAGEWADFFTVDLDDVAIAGIGPENLLAAVVFAQERSCVRDVFVQGRAMVRDGEHPLKQEIVTTYAELAQRAWKH